MRMFAVASQRMPEQMPSILIEAFANHANPPALRFVFGEGIETLTLGTEADWRIDAAGIAPVHAALHFDGKTLYVVGRPESPIYVDGQSVGSDWLAIQPPVTLELGTARLDVYDFGADSPHDLITKPGVPPLSPRDDTHSESVVMRRVTPLNPPDEEPSTDVIPVGVMFAQMDQVESRLKDLRSANDGLDALITEDDEPETLELMDSRARKQTETLRAREFVPAPLQTREFVPAPERRVEVALWKQFPIVFGVIAIVIGVCIAWLMMSRANLRESTITLPAPKAAGPVAPLSARQPEVAAPAPSHVDVERAASPPTEAPEIGATDSPNVAPEEQERRAIVALWNGDRREALRLYKQLLAQHPDSDLYQQAVQSLKRRGR